MAGTFYSYADTPEKTDIAIESEESIEEDAKPTEVVEQDIDRHVELTDETALETKDNEDTIEMSEAYDTDEEFVKPSEEPTVGESNSVVEENQDIGAPDSEETDTDTQWYLDAINAREAWEISKGDGSIVAVIDTGVLATHEDLVDGISEVTSTYVRNGSVTGGTDKSGHGTAVAGIIIAADNDKGIIGVAPGARIISIKTGGNAYRDSNISLAAVVEAMDYAVNAGADIINLSIGLKTNLAEKYPQLTEPLYAAIQKATAAGIPVVCAAGNASNGDAGNMFFPATMEETIAVGAIQRNDDGTMELWDKSCTGTAIDLVAPGKDILTTGLVRQYEMQSGTSFSAPMVSGAIASLISLDRKYNNTKDLTVKQIRDLLQQSATDMGEEGRDEKYGAGLLNVRKLLDLYIRDYHAKNQSQGPDNESPGETQQKPEEGEKRETVSEMAAENEAAVSVTDPISDDTKIDLEDFIRFCRSVEGEDHFMTTLEAEHIHTPYLLSETGGIGNYRCSSCGICFIMPTAEYIRIYGIQ